HRTPWHEACIQPSVSGTLPASRKGQGNPSSGGKKMNKLVRWTPNGDWMGVHDEVNRLFDTLLAATPSSQTTWRPAVDVRETGDEFFVRMDLPGLDSKDVKVSVFENTLTVSGERRESAESKDEKWHHVERFHGAFERRFELGKAVQG